MSSVFTSAYGQTVLTNQQEQLTTTHAPIPLLHVDDTDSNAADGQGNSTEVLGQCNTPPDDKVSAMILHSSLTMLTGE